MKRLSGSLCLQNISLDNPDHSYSPRLFLDSLFQTNSVRMMSPSWHLTIPLQTTCPHRR